MITDERIITYMHSLDKEEPEKLVNLRREAEEAGVPIIRKEMESFLSVLLMLKKPVSILEIGAGIGYSALYMAEHSAVECHITTIENYDKRIPEVRENVGKFGREDRITLIADDAVKVLASLKDSFDLIFLDAAKGQYITMLPDILRLLAPGGILLADNVLQDGEIVQSRYVTPHRQRTIHERMREFLWEVKHSDLLETSVIPIGDGITLSIKKETSEA